MDGAHGRISLRAACQQVRQQVRQCRRQVSLGALAELRDIPGVTHRRQAGRLLDNDDMFIDMAKDFPQDPALAADAIHFRYEGLSLQAWIYVQRLIPIIEERMAAGRLPRAAQTIRAAHPAFPDGPPRLVGLEELRAQCR